MKKNKLFIKSLLVALLLASISATSYGAGLEIKLDDRLLELGPGQEAFVEDGVSYLPVRSLTEALGKSLGWDGENRIVYIGRQPAVKAQSRLDLVDFIKEYNIYSQDGGRKDYGNYRQGLENMVKTYEENRHQKLTLAGKELVTDNINIYQQIFPVYNELESIRFSIAYDPSPVKIQEYLGPEKKEASLRLDGGNSRVKVLRKGQAGYELINLVSKADQLVNKNSNNKLVSFELPLRDVYGLELPKNAIDIEFTRNREKLTVYLDGRKLIPTNSKGKMLEPIIRDGRTYLPIRSLAEAMGRTVSWKEGQVHISSRELARDPKVKSLKEVLKSHGGERERALVENQLKEAIYIQDPRTGDMLGLDSLIHIGYGELDLKGDFTKLRGKFLAGSPIFQGNYKSPRDYDPILANKANTGLIYRQDGQEIFDAEKYFRSQVLGENVLNSKDRARLRPYMPSQLVDFELDLRDLDKIILENLTVLDLEFVAR